MLRTRAVERLTGELDAWSGSPVLAYGFEDLTGAEWRLLEALAARVDVHVSLPYEPGRAAFASLARTAGDLAALAGTDIVELPPRSEAFCRPRRTSRGTCSRTRRDRARRRLDPFLEGADGARSSSSRRRSSSSSPAARGRRRSGSSARPSSASVPASRRHSAARRPLRSRPRPPRATAFGQALACSASPGPAGQTRAYAYLRSPYSGVPRPDVDWLEDACNER
jgi:hypothetical protein